MLNMNVINAYGTRGEYRCDLCRTTAAYVPGVKSAICPVCGRMM